MVSFDIDSYRFQVRAAAVFVSEGHVLLHRVESEAIWALPGGRIEAGEDAAAAVVREMSEEIGEAIVCGQLLYVAENFFLDRSKPNHEIGLYFEASFGAGSRLLDMSQTHSGIEGIKRLEFQWFRRADLASVELHPAFLRESLSKPTLAFQHVVQRG